MSDDKRIGVNDRSATEDKLGCQKYYDGIADFILHCDTPMTVAIEGDWGSGKSSAMNIIQKKLKEKNDLGETRCILVSYNAWKFSKYGTERFDVTWLNVGLYQQVSLACGKNITSDTIKSKFAKNAGNVATALFGAIGGENSADAVSEIVDGIKDKTYSIEKVIKHIRETASEQKDKGKRIIIFIDDLDRLKPEDAVDFLEYIKAFMDCEGIVFVLAVDFEVVWSGVKAKYGADIEEEKARQFFDKIIQLPFEVPVIQYDIKKIVEDCVHADDNTIERYIEVIEGILENNKNPRTIKRAFNMHSLYLNILNHDIATIKTIKNYDFYLFVIALLQITNKDRYKKLVEAAKKDDRVDHDELINQMRDILSDEEMPDFIKVLHYYANVFGNGNHKKFKKFQDKMASRSKAMSDQDAIRKSSFNSFLRALESDEFALYGIDVAGNTVTFKKDDDSFFKIRNHPINDIQIEVSQNYNIRELEEKGVQIKENGITRQDPNKLGYYQIKNGNIQFNSVIVYIENNEGSHGKILDWLLGK